MDLLYTSPIKFDFHPVPGSTLNFQFKLKASQKSIKINIDTNIFYKDPFIIGKVFLANSGVQSVYTSSKDQNYSLKFKIPEFNQKTQSYINVALENPDFRDKVIIEDMKVETEMTYAHPNVIIAVPHTQPKIAPQPPIITSQPRSDAAQPVTQPINEWYDKIMFVSTWNINCGIALYTKDLLESLEKIKPGNFMVRSVESSNHIGAKLVHLQNELSIMPTPPIVGGKVIITWHTITRNISDIVRKFESQLDVVAHIIPCEGGREFLTTSKDVYVINLGSKIIPQMDKEDARRILGLAHITKPIGFVFGFQSPNKNFNRLINASRNYGIHLIISGSTHFGGYKSNISGNENVTFLDRYLTDEEIDLYALASDLLLFDYELQDHYSSSAALHRTVGSGRPLTCTNIKHFSDINGPPKFLDQKGLEESINYVMTNIESLSKISLEFAQKTSWEEVAKKHIEIYKKYVDL